MEALWCILWILATFVLGQPEGWIFFGIALVSYRTKTRISKKNETANLPA